MSHWALPCALAAASVRGIKPHLAVLHSADVHALCHLPGAGRWARRIACGSDGLWFVTQAHCDRFFDLLPARERPALRKRAWVAPMGIDLPARTAGERERARRELRLTGFAVLALGRLVPVKGIDVLLRASQGRPWTLLIAGDGPERATWEAQARATGTDARFFGEVAGTQKSLLLTAADACAVPSRVLPSGRSEGLPVALLEAMAHGLPVVASAVGGIPALLSGPDRAGLLVPPDRPDDLAHAIERLRIDTELRAQLGAVARVCAERHRWSRAIEPAVALLSPAHRHAEITPSP